ncbi:DNA cytosine methyltransferase [Longispora sp. K20-0274]|uniref:DNA cytosine methyltransferase n=1 Tax=Longispora sp. K20-0274 TaxID=3088255 RepID=UPI00399B1D40
MSFYGVKLLRSDDLKLAERTDGCTKETFVEWCEMHRASGARLAIDLFSGAGGLSLGITEAGWTVAASVDHDEKALKTHHANFPGVALDVDLGDRESLDELIAMLRKVKIDLVAGGPPCQPFSRAGRSKIRSLVDAGTRDAIDHRKELWRAFVEVVEKVKPRAVLMENVPDMALGDDLRVVRTIVDRLERAGYLTEVQLVDAWQFGVPQHRQRMILLARRDGASFTWPDKVEKETTLRQAISDLPRLGETTGDRRLEHRGGRLSPFAKRMRKGAEPGVVHDHMTRPVRDDDREAFAGMTSKTLYSDIPEHLRRYRADTFDDKYKRLDWEYVSRSITAHIAKDGYWYIHPEEARTLTVREAARIQTFPDWFRFAGTRSDAFRQIGNAVPPMLGEAAARALTPTKENVAAEEAEDRDWRAIRTRLAKWAAWQRKGDNWYLIPGEGVTPAVAALVAMLRGTPGLGDALEPVRGTVEIDTATLEKILARQNTRLVRAAVERFAQFIGGPVPWSQSAKLAEYLELRPAESDLFFLLAGDDVLETSQPSVRVASRVIGSESETTNRRTAGRLDLSKLVGSGDSAPARMAAIRLVGTTVCRPTGSKCGECPFQPACRKTDSGAV